MRKIISILVALGLVLAFSAVAMPTAAQAPCATVTVTPACAGASATYNVTFNAPATLQPANDLLSFDFGAGTTFGTFLAGDITVNGFNVDVTKVVKSGTHLEFPIPAAAGVILAGSPVEVIIKKVVNPGVAGTYTLGLDYKLVCCDPVDFCAVDYTIIPAASTYGFLWDSSMTYNGIALGFVPPFKVCGQDTFPGVDIGGKWANYVNFILTPTLIGCAGPCASPVDLVLNVTAAPAGANVTLSFNGTIYYPVVGTAMPIGNPVTLGFNSTFNWSAAIHFDAVGDYELCLDAICPAGTPTCPECISGETVVAHKCWDISVYQFKTATKIPLFRKWNLISLPLVPLEEDMPIEDVIAALPNADTLIKAIYYFDQCADDWSVWGNGQTSLATLEDGVSYWVKVEYSHVNPLLAPGLPVGGLWVWGTPKPVPPNSPSAYPVCTGWNMVGLTGYGLMAPLATTLDGTYLWNWQTPLGYGAIYGWDATTQMWWSLLPTGAQVLPNLQNGEGYWISFAHDGMIYPP